MDKQQWMTLGSTTSMGGSTFGVTVLQLVWRKLGGPNSPWVPFVLAILFVFGFAVSAELLGSMGGWLVTAVNVGIVFLSAIGANEGAVYLKNPPPKVSAQPNAARPKVWIRSYFRSTD